MNNKSFYAAIAIIALPLLTVVVAKGIDSHTVTKTVNEVLAYNAAHPEALIQLSLNKH